MAGDSLLVINGSHLKHVPISDIMNVSYSQLVNPPRVDPVAEKSRYISEASQFCAPVRFVPFSTSPFIDKLIERIVPRAAPIDSCGCQHRTSSEDLLP